MTGRKIIFITNEFFDYNDDKELPKLKDKIVTEFRKDT